MNQINTEIRAGAEGVHMALRWPDVPMILESDCESVVTKIRTKTWEVGAQLKEFHSNQD